jgi:serine phosphatase RsbU (regulator of sigma subunit)
VRAVDAGSPQMMVLREVRCGISRWFAQFPLGMFETSEYHAQTFTLRTGDRLFVVSDGVFDAAGEQPLRRVGAAPFRPADRRAGAVAGGPLAARRLRAFVGGDLDDDAVAVCLDWTGHRT